MKKALYILWQYLWGLPQNLVGAVLYLYYRLKGCPHFSYQGARVILWTVDGGSMSVGRYLFLHQSWRPKDQFLLAHEYGHTIQSLILGPLYLPLVGLPSILWAGLPCFERLRRKKRRSYYSVYPENWATSFGKRFARKAPVCPPKLNGPIQVLKNRTE